MNSELINVVTEYLGDVTWIILFLASLIYLFIRHRKEKAAKLMLIVIIVGLIVIMNPFSYKIIGSYFTDAASFYRFLWPVPYVIVVAIAVIRFISDASDGLLGNFLEKHYKVLCFIVALALVFSLEIKRDSFLESTLSNLPDNKYEISQDVMDVSYLIGIDWDGKNPEKQPRVAYPLSLAYEYPSYDAKVISVTSRNVYYYAYLNNQLTDKYADGLVLAMLCTDGDVSDMVAVKKAVKDTDTDYLVVPKAKDVKGALEKERYLFVGETPNYYIYSVE